jgi:hypothetical protein
VHHHIQLAACTVHSTCSNECTLVTSTPGSLLHMLLMPHYSLCVGTEVPHDSRNNHHLCAHNNKHHMSLSFFHRVTTSSQGPVPHSRRMQPRDTHAATASAGIGTSCDRVQRQLEVHFNHRAGPAWRTGPALYTLRSHLHHTSLLLHEASASHPT